MFIFTEALTLTYIVYNLDLMNLNRVANDMSKIALRFTFVFVLTLLLTTRLCAETDETTTKYTAKYPYIFHLIQKESWDAALASNTTYYPPTYKQDEFTHATANPDFLLIIGNHFYKDVTGEWLCLRMSVDSLQSTGVKTIFEGTAPVGDKQPDFPGTDSELFPHIMGGINAAAVLQAHRVVRAKDGTFLTVVGVLGGD